MTTLFQHGSVFEWVLFVIGNACWAVHLWIVYDAIRDARFVRDAQSPKASPLAMFVAEQNLVSESIRMLVSMTVAISGWVGVSFAPPPGAFSISAVWKAHALITIAAFALISGLSARWYRRKILTYTETRRRSSDAQS